jgi:hypothetical protein
LTPTKRIKLYPLVIERTMASEELALSSLFDYIGDEGQELKEDILKELEVLKGEAELLNAQYLPFALNLIREYPELTAGDVEADPEDFKEWYQQTWDFIAERNGAVMVACLDDEPFSVVLAQGYYLGSRCSVEVGYASKRGVNPYLNSEAFKLFLDFVFKQDSDCQIARAEIAETNRAAKIGLIRTGFSHPEPRGAIGM